MWFRWMMIAFAFNGISPFGLRILAARGLGTRYTAMYLVFWYLAGLLFLLAIYLREKQRPRMNDLAIGAGLGFFSVCGQSALGLALAKGLPGNVVFPVVLAGGLFIVVAAGVIIFKERIGAAGIAGIVIGILSIVLLSVE
jgi:drug/metabolite transporter (DMT)-like permease